MKEVFVYGTLKRGGANHHYLSRQEFISDATTTAGFTLYSLGDYPGMVRVDAADSVVTGEIWRVDAPTLARLDVLEGLTEGLYVREPIRLDAPHAERNVETYLYARPLGGARLIGQTWPG